MKKLISKLVIDGVKVTTAYPLNTILIYIVEWVTSQEQQISSLELKLDQHMITPFRKGKLFIEEAQYAEDMEKKREFVKDALKEFAEVSELDLPNYRLLSIQACVNVGFCYELLSDPRNADRWYQKTYQRLTNVFPMEMELLEAYEKRLQSYEAKLSSFNKDNRSFQKRKKAYDQEFQKYQVELKQYQEMVGRLAYLSQKDKDRIKDYILKALAIEGLRPKTDNLTTRNLLNTPYSPRSPRLTDYSSLRRPGSLTNPKRPGSLKGPLSNNPLQPRSPLGSSYIPKRQTPNYQDLLNTNRRRLDSLLPQETLRKEDVAELYKILGIERDVQKDYSLILSIVQRGPSARTSSQISLSSTYRIRRLLDTSTSPPVLAALEKILSGNKEYLALIKPSPPPAAPVAPDSPKKPKEPDSLEIFAAIENQDQSAEAASIFSKFFGKLFKSDQPLNGEAILFARDVSKLLKARR